MKKTKVKSSLYDKSFGADQSFSIGEEFCGRLTSVLTRMKFNILLEILVLTFSESGIPYLQTAPHRDAPTARSALQRVDVDRAHVARSRPVTLAGCNVQAAEAIFRTKELSFSRNFVCPPAHGAPSAHTQGTQRCTVSGGGQSALGMQHTNQVIETFCAYGRDQCLRS